MFRQLLQKTLTYLTIVSAIALPVVSVLWMRSYSVSDRVARAQDGRLTVLGSTNGEFTLWVSPTTPNQSFFEHRKRESMQGLRANRIFTRVDSEVHFDTLGFAYGDLAYLPSRGIPSTGPSKVLIVPMWAVALLLALLPARLLLRNTQSSAEWTRQREAELAAEQAKDEKLPTLEPEPPLPVPGFRPALSHRPMRTAAAQFRRMR